MNTFIQEKMHIDNIFMNFNVACFSRIYSDEDFPIAIGFINDTKKNQMILEIQYDKENPFKEYKLKNIRLELEQIATDFNVKILFTKSIRENKLKNTIDNKRNIDKYISDGKESIDYYFIIDSKPGTYRN